MQIGSWGTPELGLTEKLSNFFGQGRTSQGGSNLFGSQSQTTLVPSGTQNGQPAFAQSGSSGAYGIRSGVNGGLLGASTVNNGSTNNIQGGVIAQNANNVNNGQGSAEDAARAQYEAQLASEEAMFGRNQAMAENQKTEAGRQQDEALGLLSNVWGQAQTRSQSQKDESGKLTGEAIGQAGDTARNTQRSNRNVLRALGILNSTYATDKLQEPTNEFDKERARLVRVNIDNVKKIDDWTNERFSEYQANVTSVKNQFATIIDKINTDMRFNGQDRLASLKAANAALNTKLANIDQEFRAIQQNAEQAKMNFATQIANLYLNQNPSANVNGILSSAMNTANQVYSPQQVGITDQKKKGLLTG